MLFANGGGSDHAGALMLTWSRRTVNVEWLSLECGVRGDGYVCLMLAIREFIFKGGARLWPTQRHHGELDVRSTSDDRLNNAIKIGGFS